MSIEKDFKKIMMRAFNPPSKPILTSEDEIMDDLILKGGISYVGMTENKEPLYSFTPKIKDIMPELYEEHLNIVNSELMNLWQKGFLNIDFLESDPTVTLTEKAFQDDEVLKLSSDEQWSLNETKRLMKR
jgi:hypothetical protein